MLMENSDPQTTNPAKWPWIISLILLLLGGVSLIPAFILCIYNGAKMNGFTWLLAFLPFLLLTGGLVFGIISFSKKKAGSLPLIILSGLLGIASLGFNCFGLFIGGIAGAFQNWNDSMNEEARRGVTLEGFLEGAEGKTLSCSYRDGEEYKSFEDSSGHAKEYLKTDFVLKEIEKPASFYYSAYLSFDHENGESTYLYLGESYTTVRILQNYARYAELYYSVSETQGKGLYNVLKSTYETMQNEISEDVEKGKENATYQKFLSEMDENVSNLCYYVSSNEALTDADKQALALLKSLNPTLSVQKDLEIGYDFFTIGSADFVYGLEPYKDVSLNRHYAAFKFETGEIHVGYSFLDRYRGEHFICSEYAIDADASVALKTALGNIFLA